MRILDRIEASLQPFERAEHGEQPLVLRSWQPEERVRLAWESTAGWRRNVAQRRGGARDEDEAGRLRRPAARHHRDPR